MSRKKANVEFYEPGDDSDPRGWKNSAGELCDPIYTFRKGTILKPKPGFDGPTYHYIDDATPVRQNPRRKNKLPPLLNFSNTGIETWFERDRAHVALTADNGQRTIIEWWDEDVAQAVEDGFLEPGDYHRSAYDYAVSLGIIRAA